MVAVIGVVAAAGVGVAQSATGGPRCGRRPFRPGPAGHPTAFGPFEAVEEVVPSGAAGGEGLGVASAAPGTLAACGLATGSMLTGDLCRTRLREGPSMAVPDGPGLGVELDDEAFARFGRSAA